MRWTTPPRQRRPAPQPLETDDRRIVLVGTAVWLVLGLLVLARRSALVAAGEGWWLWVCVAAVALGVVGVVHLHREHRR